VNTSVRRVISVVASASLLGAAGCSMFAPKQDRLVIDSEPQGAVVTVAGRPRFTTPATLTVPCDEDITLIFRKEGYYTQSQTVRRTLSKCGVLDVAGTVLFLVPAVGLFFPGAYTLDQHTVFVTLFRDDRPAGTAAK